jgi:mTERF.
VRFKANLSHNDLKEALLKQPSLLQYSIDTTLRPKLQFLVEELHIDKSSIPRIIRTSPAILGLSLTQNIMPKIAIIQEECNLSSNDIGIIVVTVPSILSLSLKKKIKPCFEFLRSKLQLTNPSDLGSIILSSPRILMHGVDTSLSPKLQMIQQALLYEGLSDTRSISEMISIVKKNPSILATSNTILRARIDKYIYEGKSLKESFKPKSVGRKKIYTQQNIDKPMREASSRVGVKKGHFTTNSNRNSFDETKQSGTSMPDLQHSSSLRDIKKLPFSLYDFQNEPVSIVAFASGSIFPADDINTVRGTRRAGGIAIQFPQLTEAGEVFHSRFQDATRLSFGMIMPRTDISNLPQYGLVQAGFPFLRPSRARCELYACHGALKVTLQLLKQTAEEKNMRDVDVNIDIYTHSTYAWNLLKDSEILLDWGSASTVEDVHFDIPGPLSLANTDLLFPLTKTMHRMANNAVINRSRNKRLCIGRTVNIRFQYIGDLLYDEEIGKVTKELQYAAKKAAIWQYERL